MYLKRNLGVIAALLFIIVSLVKVFSTTKEYIFAGKNTLILSHWNMEDGYREGLQKVIDNFIEMKREQGIKVNIIQTVVPWRGYEQWSITQLLGGKPVDIMSWNIQDVYVGKYFIPLDQYVSRINPYNDDTPLDGLAWKQTYIDDMEGGFRRSLLGYYGVGVSTFVKRIYYNMDLLEKATGSSEPPKTFEEWLKKCEEISNYAKNNKKIVIPIIFDGNGGAIEYFFFYFSNSILYSYLDEIDLDFDGGMSPLEIYSAKKNEVFNWQDEEVKSPIMMLLDLSKYFSKGFSTIDYEQSKFLFLNNKAVFMPDGSWQSRSMFANAPFKLGIFELPQPADNSIYKKFYDGNISEVNRTVYGTYGITRKCRNIDLAVDFLMFMTSYKQNILWNKSCMWVPAVRFAKLSPILEKFRPNIKGIHASVNSWPPSGFHGYFMRTNGEFQQELTTYLLEKNEKNYTYEKFIDELDNTYNRLAKEDTNEYLLDKLRSIQNLEYNMSFLEINEEYFGYDKAKMVGIKEKKKMLIEGISNTERIYNLDCKLYKEVFN